MTTAQKPNKSFVRVQPQVAFNNGPWDVNPVWTDLTTYTRDDSSIQVSRGRSNEFSTFEAGKLTGLVLDNRSRIFDPGYTSSPAPFANNINPSKQLQLLVEYPWLPGQLPEGRQRNTGWVAGVINVGSTYDSGTTYDQAGLTYDSRLSGGVVTANLSLVTGDAPAGISPQQALAAQVTSGTSAVLTYDFPANQFVALQYVTFSIRAKMVSANAAATPQSQVMKINFRDVNNALISGVSQGFTTPKRIWGDGNWDMGYITVQIPANTVTVELELNPQVYQTNDTVYYDAIVFDYAKQWIQKPLAFVYVDDWKLTYKGRDALCSVSASDALAAFSVKDLYSPLYEQTIASLPNLRHYWTFSERADWIQPYHQEYAPGTARLTPKGFVAWGVPGPVLTDLETGVGLTQDDTDTISGWFDAQSLINPPSTIGGASGQGWSIGFWCQQTGPTDRILDIGQTQDYADWYNNNPSDTYGFQVYTNDNATPATAIQLISMGYDSAGRYQNIVVFFSPPPDVVDPRIPAYTLPGSFYDGAYHFVVITLQPDNVTYRIFVDGQQVTPRTPSNSPALWGSVSGQDAIATGPFSFPANIKSLVGGSQGNPNGGYTGQLAHLMVVDRALAPSEISNLYNIAQNQWFGQSPQSRVSAILNTVSFPASKMNLDVGSSTFDAETAFLAQTNSLQYLQYVEASESGWFFVDGQGNARLIGRLGMVKKTGTTPQWVLGDLWPQNPAQELPMFDTPDIDNSNTLIYTEAEGSMGTGASSSGHARKTSGNLYYYSPDNRVLLNQGKRSISKTNMLNTTDTEVYDTLQYLVTKYQYPKQRLQKIKVMPIGCDELMNFVLNVEIGQVIQVNLRPPPGGSNMTSYVARVQHIQHTLGRRKWETEIDVATVDTGTYLNLDDPTLGKLDSGNQLFF